MAMPFFAPIETPVLRRRGLSMPDLRRPSAEEIPSTQITFATQVEKIIESDTIATTTQGGDISTWQLRAQIGLLEANARRDARQLEVCKKALEKSLSSMLKGDVCHSQGRGLPAEKPSAVINGLMEALSKQAKELDSCKTALGFYKAEVRRLQYGHSPEKQNCIP